MRDIIKNKLNNHLSRILNEEQGEINQITLVLHRWQCHILSAHYYYFFNVQRIFCPFLLS